MKKIIFSLLALGFLFLVGVVNAQMGMMGGYWQNGSKLVQSDELESVLEDIYSSQNVSDSQNIDCSRVTNDQFNELGDAYMGVMIPDKEQHEAMDNMMGGEGSESLRRAHINMGRSYLGCWSDYSSGPVFMSMMSNSTQGGLMGNFGWGSNMMGGYGFYTGFGWITMILFWTLLVLGMLAIIKWLRK